MPFALLAMILGVTLLYTGVQLVALGTLPNLAASESPVAEAAAVFVGPAGGWLMTVAAVLSIVGTTGNTVLMGPRYLYAVARDGYGPAALARVHARYRTPAVAIVSLAFLASAEPENLLAGVVALAFGALVYGLRSAPRGFW